MEWHWIMKNICSRVLLRTSPIVAPIYARLSRFQNNRPLSTSALSKFKLPLPVSQSPTWPQSCRHIITDETSPNKTMRFIQFERDGRRNIGVELSNGGDVVDLNSANPNLPRDMKSFLEQGQRALIAARQAVDSGKNILKRGDMKVLAPITGPDKVICVGMNYTDHCEEQGAPIPTEPVIFNKFPSSIIGTGENIIYPEETQELDWEVELTIVIGKQGKKISESEAMSYVFGYTVAHDVSARDWQLRRNGGQWILGKTMDTFCPLGPAIVMKEDITDPHNLGLRTRVNGVTKQDSSTNKLVFKTETLISFVSRFFTLLPGDIILTGTPPGVGCFRKPPEYLKRGDTVECEIDQIGTIINKVL